MKCICHFCNKEFIGRKESKFCSQNCKTSYYQTPKGKEEQRQKIFEFRRNSNLSCNDTLFTKTCLQCGKTFTTYSKDKKFCSVHCSATYNGLHSKNRKHTKETKDKISKRISASNHKVCTCNICGNTKGSCKYPDICRILSTNTLSVLAQLGFNKSLLGTELVYQEFNKIRNLCFQLYVIKKLSLVEISELYSLTSPSSLLTAFNNFKIHRRSISDSLKNAIDTKRLIPQKCESLPKPAKSNYHQGWHTTWDNQQVYYRSSYELDLCNELDQQRVHYIMEDLHIPYFHHIENRMKTAFPDFYIPSLNLIIEVKSDYTYCRGEMIDRFKSYKHSGYNYKLILEHKDFGKCLPKTKETFYSYLKSYKELLIPFYRKYDI